MMTDSETKVKTGLLALVLATGPAEAWTCPHGQLLRVHMGKCVSMESALARPYERRMRRAEASVRPNEREGTPIWNEDKAPIWNVEITKLPTVPPADDDGRDEGIEKLKEQLRAH
jgi:hypothetical protein